MARVCPGYKVRGQGIFTARATLVDFTAPQTPKLSTMTREKVTTQAHREKKIKDMGEKRPRKLERIE